MSNPSEKLQPSPTVENRQFPYTDQEELRQVNELLREFNVQVICMPGVGYWIQNKDVQYIAEAPVVAFDFDDTSAQTSLDKKQCHQDLIALGIDSAIVTLCDELARVYVGDTEPTYQVLLEQVLLSHALNFDISNGNDLATSLKQLRAQLVSERNFDASPIDPRIQSIYLRTRYSVQLYSDVLPTMQLLRMNIERPSNVIIMTYGEPVFQLTKVLPLLRSGLITQVWLTKARKGTYFKKILELNPFKDIEMIYTYSETPRDEGVNFKDWWIPIVLFDDDAKQVESFMGMAEAEGIPLQGVVRVRRKGAKRADTATQLNGPMTGEITPISLEDDDKVDVTFFTAIFDKLMWNAHYKFIKRELQTKGREALHAYNDIIQGLAAAADMDVELLKNRLLQETTLYSSDPDEL